MDESTYPIFFGAAFIVIGAFCMWGAITSPSFFVNSRQFKRYARLFGEQNMKIGYTIFGLVLVLVGLGFALELIPLDVITGN